MAMRPGFEKKLEDYQIEYVIFLDPDFIRRPVQEHKRHIASYLARHKDWKLVFWDDKSMLFLRDIPKYSELIKKYEYKAYNPFTAMLYPQEFEVNVRTNPEAVKNESRRKAETEPEGFLYKGMNDMANRINQGRQ
jgi:hypothetical protein